MFYRLKWDEMVQFDFFLFEHMERYNQFIYFLSYTRRDNLVKQYYINIALVKTGHFFQSAPNYKYLLSREQIKQKSPR